MPISLSLCFKAAALCLLAWFSIGVAYSAGMVPQTPVLVVEEGVGEAVTNVRNTDLHPALLHTSIENVEEDDEMLLLVTPPLARVEAGGIQQVRFILQNPRPLQVERSASLRRGWTVWQCDCDRPAMAPSRRICCARVSAW